MTYNFTKQDLLKFQEELHQETDKLADLEIKIVNTIGKTKARKFWDNIRNGRAKIINARDEIESIMNEEFGN